MPVAPDGPEFHVAVAAQQEVQQLHGVLYSSGSAAAASGGADKLLVLAPADIARYEYDALSSELIDGDSFDNTGSSRKSRRLMLKADSSRASGRQSIRKSSIRPHPIGKPNRVVLRRAWPHPGTGANRRLQASERQPLSAHFVRPPSTASGAFSEVPGVEPPAAKACQPAVDASGIRMRA